MHKNEIYFFYLLNYHNTFCVCIWSVLWTFPCQYRNPRNNKYEESMSIHQVELGKACKVLSTGEEGTLKKIYHYPTRLEIETSDGKVNFYSTHEVEFSGVSRAVPNYKTSDFPSPEANFSTASYSPFMAECHIQRFISTTPELLWKTITSLQLLNVWMPRVQRALPIVDTDRYVLQYSFDRSKFESGLLFKVRPFSLSKYFKCEVQSAEKDKELVLEMKLNPLYKETITISLEPHEKGVFVQYKKSSRGLFSFLSVFRFYDREAHTLALLDSIVPKIDFNQSEEGDGMTSTEAQWGGFASKQDYIDYAIHMGIQGKMDFINGISEKPIRGMAKAGVVKAKRTGVTPPLPEKPAGGSDQSTTPTAELSPEDMIAIAVNKALDGDKEFINSIENKATRGKAKALLVKINRGKADRPAMPHIPDTPSTEPDSPQESEEDLIVRLIADGVSGNMDEINALEDRVLRGKIKSGIVKAKRAK